MEYKLNKLPEIKERFIVGFLDENAYDEYHNMMLQGVAAAAEKYGINIVHFGHFAIDDTTKNTTHENILLEYVKQFKLDGLIFLGWARTVSNIAFRSLSEKMPLLSLGTEFEDIPSVTFRGENYIEEILLHLIEKHKLRNIAFVEAFFPDKRSDAYRNIMQRSGIYNPRLFVSARDLQHLSMDKRGQGAVKILLDERRENIEAIVDLYNSETYEIICELERKGLKVPENIAVTSYEEGVAGRFLAPAYTTVYFPWMELGYHACELMYRLLSEGHIPMQTDVPGKVIYRDSCGCVPYDAWTVESDTQEPADRCFEELDEKDLMELAERFSSVTSLGLEDARMLLEKFRQAFYNGSGQDFLLEAEMQFRRLKYSRVENDSEKAVSVFRRLLLPYFLPYVHSGIDKLVWAENIFYQAQIVLLNKQTSALFGEDDPYKNIYGTLKEIGQILITNFSIKSLMDSLEANLSRIMIRGCSIYLFDNMDNGELFNQYHLEFEYCGEHGRYPVETNNSNAAMSFRKDLFKEDRPYLLVSQLLYVGNEFMGFVIFEPKLLDLRMYHFLGMQISNSLNGAILFEKLEAGYSLLMEQAHKKGMADISTGILHNIGNILSSVNVTLQSLSALVEDNRVHEMLMANEMLEQNIDRLEDFIKNDPKGKKLMQFYVSLSDVFEDFRGKLQYSVERLADKFNLIDEIITAQQDYTGVKSYLKPLDLVPVIEDVLHMHEPSMEKHHIRIVRRYGRTAIALAQRTKLFHILTNLVKNAIESMESSSPDRRILTVEVSQDKGNRTIRIGDTGAGIAPEDLESIFAYGFTTKKSGHGFGLHSCANYMTEMQGRMWAESMGSGKGATFVLQFQLPGHS